MPSKPRHLVLVVLLAVACSGDPADPGDPDAGDPGVPDAAVSASDAPVGAPDATVVGPDAGGDDPALAIRCGAASCARASQVCCFTGYPNITTMCTPTGQCANLTASCDGPEDCAGGDICCGDQSGAVCKPAGQCTAFPSSQLCHTSDDCPGSHNCHMSQFVPWPIC